MEHPYRGLPSYAFWNRAVAGVEPSEMDPVVEPKFTLGPRDKVATAGSCFAQHIARALSKDGFNFLVTEPPSEDERAHGAEAIYSARYGNIYTTLQLKQLFDQAYAQAEPACAVWRRPDGHFVDAFRPTEFADGFDSEEAVRAERERHLAKVRETLEICDVFVFTLGLTECWVADQDGFAVPLAPNVVATPTGGATYSFRNLAVDAMVDQADAFLMGLRAVNPDVRVILTVSPVPLAATYEKRHVLVSTAYSKAALRVTADMLSKGRDWIQYFPAYEMVSMLSGASAFDNDLRTVNAPTVARVMRVFKRHYTRTETVPAPSKPGVWDKKSPISQFTPSINEFKNLNCDEQLLNPSKD